jgi:hypothetical protein
MCLALGQALSHVAPPRELLYNQALSAAHGRQIVKQRRHRKLRQRQQGASARRLCDRSKNPFQSSQQQAFSAIRKIYLQHEKLFKKLADS